MRARRAFIRHPVNLPIRYRRGGAGEAGTSTACDLSSGGICFVAREPFAGGERIELSIPTCDGCERFAAEVAWCRARNQSHLVGVRFLHANDAYRARLVEQACHIEAYRQYLHCKTGREINVERAAKQWIERYAADFPYIA